VTTAGIWLGAGIMIVSQAATLAGIEPFASWNTPIAWTGFILFADSIVFRVRGSSWIRSAPFEFALLALVSIPLWIVFEGFNLVLNNWHYTGLTENFWLRQFGYAWAFATIWPAIFEAAELIGCVRAGWAGRAGMAGQSTAPLLPALPAFPARPALSIAAGTAMLALPFAVPGQVARYLAAPVFLGFILLLDPLNRRLGAESLSGDLHVGRSDRLVNLLAAGLLCGVLWEFWNFWARAKWVYTVPIMERLKIFEMPLPGYFGFPPFAIECFTMYVFVRRMFTKLGRRVAV
jgi:hypothetical protein